MTSYYAIANLLHIIIVLQVIPKVGTKVSVCAGLLIVGVAYVAYG